MSISVGSREYGKEPWVTVRWEISGLAVVGIATRLRAERSGV
jgi:hypothetical protein